MHLKKVGAVAICMLASCFFFFFVVWVSSIAVVFKYGNLGFGEWGGFGESQKSAGAPFSPQDEVFTSLCRMSKFSDSRRKHLLMRL